MLHHKGTSAVTLARVLARPGGAHHVGADVGAGVQRVVTLAIGHRVHINLGAGLSVSTESLESLTSWRMFG